MNASADLLRIYLEGQADLGTDEVILPHPWKPAPAQVATAPQVRAPVMEAARAPVYRETAGAPSEPTQAPAGLFETLTRAMETPKGSPAAVAAAAAKSRAPESTALPAFADLEAYWAHLEANPSLAAGDPNANVTRVVRAAGAQGAPLALVGLEPGEADLAAGLAFQGEAGALLGKMLKAIRMDPDLCYRTNLVKAARSSRPTQVELSRLGRWLQLELSLVRAPFTLLLGEACARAVLKVGKSIEEMRQEPFFIDGREFAVTWHPSELLQREALKRKAWEDLQWLQKRMSEGRS